MRLEAAERTIREEWRALPQGKRGSDANALIFAIRMTQKYGPYIRCAGDKQQCILAWVKRWQDTERRLG